jgi:hypothetical protein
LKYIVWSYDYMDASAGQKTMHRLCHELNEAGQEASVYFQGRNPAWNTPYYGGPFDDGWLAIYPEICTNNPIPGIRDGHVIRWMLNRPHAHYEPIGEWFSFLPLFDSGHPVLFLPTIELDLYYDQHLPRTIDTFWVGKEVQTRPLDGATMITRELTGDRELLARTLNQSRVMYTFDPISAMDEIARLCGSKVVFVPGDKMTKDQFDRYVASDGFGWDEVPPDFDPEVAKQRQIDQKAEFFVQLAEFIRITQAL